MAALTFHKPKVSALFTALLSISSVAAHGHVLSIIVNGVKYQGYDSASAPYQHNPGVTLGWTIEQLDNGYVSPYSYGDSSIICHRGSKPAEAHVEVSAGDVITLQWSGWPENHHGPIIDYLANCNGPCEKVDKTALEFFKISGLGLLEPGTPGRYATDVFVENGYAWNVRIPSNIASGNYVLRHELIALHNGIRENGAQNYPQCFNLKIKSSGSQSPQGHLGTELYDVSDPGIKVNIYSSSSKYEVPGPKMIEGGISSVRQQPSKATRTATATKGY